MGTSTIHDLLPIPKGTKQPHAYQVFGLEPGEQDASKIQAAMAATVTRLKDSKPSTDEKTWNGAARLVQKARKILCDADLKSELDARFGIVHARPPASVASNDGSSATRPAGNTPADPLAAILPSGDPLAAVLPSSDPLAAIRPEPNATPPPPAAESDPPQAAATRSSVAAATPPGPSVAAAATPPGPTLIEGSLGPFGESTPQADTDVGVNAAAPVVVLKDSSPRHSRRRKSWSSSLLLAAFSMSMLALIGLLGYFLLFGPGQVAISRSNRGLTISTGPTNRDPGPAINPPRSPAQSARDQPPLRDNVMGRLAGAMPPPTTSATDRDEDTAPTDRPPPQTPPPQTPPPQTPPPQTPPAMTNDSDQPGLPGTEPTESMTTDPVAAAEMTDEMIAAAEQELGKVAALIRGAQWNRMKPAAEKLTDSPLTEDQRRRAAALYEVADLAAFYRGGIERGVQSLEVGNDFQVTDAFRVVIVETGDDLLVIRFNAKNRSYTFDEFPFTLAHKLASFSMPPDAPTTLAAKAVYQALAPNATDAHREESQQWLESIDEKVTGADPLRVAKTLKSLFAEPG